MKKLQIDRMSWTWLAETRVLLTLTLAGLGLALAAVPGAARLWQYHREAILTGQWWRLFTGHWTHWNADHAAWDLAMFAVLGMACERLSHRRLIALLVGSPLAISLVLVWFAPERIEYRGLSGIDSGLFALLAAMQLRSAWQARDRVLQAFSLVLVGLLAGKIGLEMAWGRTPFVDSTAAGFIPLPLVHAVGAAVGTLVGLLPDEALGADLFCGRARCAQLGWVRRK